MQCPLNPHTIETESRNVCRLDSLLAASASCIRDGAFRGSVAYKTRNYVNFTTPRPMCRTQRSRCDLLAPQKREESSARELEEAEIIPRESLR